MNACLPLKSVSVKFAKEKEYLKKELQRWQVLIEATWEYKVSIRPSPIAMAPSDEATTHPDHLE